MRRRTVVTDFVRALAGRSHPILVKAIDGVHYVLKFPNSPRGPNVLFNEAAGNELYRFFHLPVPGWERLQVTEAFIDQHPESWIRGPEGPIRPEAGLCFGVRFMSNSRAPQSQLFTPSVLGQVRNRAHFWFAWLIDTCCGRSDPREALFLEDDSGGLEAVFIDFGGQFGKARQKLRQCAHLSRFPDYRVYPPLGATEARKFAWVLQTFDLEALHSRIRRIPREWWAPSTATSYMDAISRLRSRKLVDSMLESFLDIGTQNPQGNVENKRKWWRSLPKAGQSNQGE